jgi:hypothetical protein
MTDNERHEKMERLVRRQLQKEKNHYERAWNRKMEYHLRLRKGDYSIILQELKKKG